MQSKPLSLIHLESGTPLLSKIAEPGMTSTIVAVYLCTPSELKKYRTEGVLPQERIDAADEMPGSEVSEVLEDFFSQHEAYQNSILKSAGVPEEALLRMKSQAMDKALEKAFPGMESTPSPRS